MRFPKLRFPQVRLRFLLVLCALMQCTLAHAQIPGLGDIINTANKIKKAGDDTARVAKGTTGLSLEEEIAIGDAVAVEIVSRYGGIWRDIPATRRVNLVGKALARFAVRQDLRWRFGILDSDAVNAFSAPGGRVFITRGLYELLLTDDELAGVLAHEIIHIDERHAMDMIARGEFLGGVSGLVAGSGVAWGQYENLVGNVVSGLLDKGFDPGTEYEADELGRELAITTGYSAGGLRVVLVRIDSQSGDELEVFSTHPATDKRLKRLPDDPVS